MIKPSDLDIRAAKKQAIYNIAIYLQTNGQTIPPSFKSSLKLIQKLLVKEVK